jgi:hypothetical protein
MTQAPPYGGNTATLPDEDVENAKNLSPDKETIERWRVAAVRNDGIDTPVDARFYMGRAGSASKVYCSVWLRSHDGQRFLSGHGTAGGGGYHKISAALGDALESAGIKLASRIDGCGESAMIHALDAVAVALGYGDCIRRVLS